MLKIREVILIKGYKVSCKKEDMDLVAIHNYIIRSYWAEGISLETMEKAITHSLCFGVFSDEWNEFATCFDDDDS